MAFHTFAGHRDSWINVLPDGAGDGYFYDHQRSSHDGFFYHFAEVRYYRWFPSVRNFLAGVAECYDTGIYTIGNDPKHPQEDYHRSDALWAKYSTQSTP